MEQAAVAFAKRTSQSQLHPQTVTALHSGRNVSFHWEEDGTNRNLPPISLFDFLSVPVIREGLPRARMFGTRDLGIGLRCHLTH
jgi:hypothetical protein